MRLTINKANLLLLFILSGLFLLVSSCSILKSTSIKNYEASKPFVFENFIKLNGNVSKDEKKRLTTELTKHWDDSIKSRKEEQFFGLKQKIKNPQVFDSANIVRSMTYMNGYLNSQGYYYATFKDSVKIDTVKDQLRATITMIVEVGKNITIDSVSFSLGDTTLQKLTKAEEKNTLLEKGEPYTKQIISAEIDRLISIYRQNGYYKFSREDLRALVDTSDANLFELTLDPFKQAQIIAEADKIRRANPTWDIDIQKTATTDSSKLIQYHIGKLYYYPETRPIDILDSLPFQKGFLEFKNQELIMRYKKGLFNYKPFKELSFLQRGDLYNENKYIKTINTLGRVGAWQQVDAKTKIRDKDSLDLYYFLVPAIKQNYTIDLEGSRNTGDIGSTNLFGISTNFSYNNKNIWKRAIQSVTTFRTGVELNIFSGNNEDLLQTFLVSMGHTYIFPKLVQPFKNWKVLENVDNKRSLLSFSGSYVDRRQFYLLRSLVTSWGYEWKKGDNLWLFKPLSIELYGIDQLPKLDTLILLNPFLKSSFNEGNVISQSVSFIKSFVSKKNKNISHYFRFGIEDAGALLGLIPTLQNKIYRYIKVEGEYRELIKFPKNKTELALRAFTGIGYNYGKDSATGITLPFFKQFIAGGPYSMRAWGLRQLGLGSSIQSDTVSTTEFRDRFGDMQLEANIEYRFPLATIAGVKLGSALFADIGNIWNVKKDLTNPGSNFTFNTLAKDLAIGIGTGIRVDFSYFLIRLDFGFKLKDPARQGNNGWITDWRWTEFRQSGLKVNNYSFQLGIGLPF